MLKRCLFRLYRSLSGLNFWFRQRFTAAGFLVLWGLVISAIVGLDTNFSLAYQIFWFLLCLLTVSIAFGLFSRARFHAFRQLPRFGTVGLPIQYSIAVENQTAHVQRDLQVGEAQLDPRPSLIQFLRTPEPGEEKRNWFDRLGGHYRWHW